jgi:segregation and condensation protein B
MKQGKDGKNGQNSKDGSNGAGAEHGHNGESAEHSEVEHDEEEAEGAEPAEGAEAAESGEHAAEEQLADGAEGAEAEGAEGANSEEATAAEPGLVPAPAEDGPTQPYLQAPSFEDQTDVEGDGLTDGLGAEPQPATWDGPTRPGAQGELPEGAIPPELSSVSGVYEAVEVATVESPARLESIIESLLFASDKPLTIVELKRLLGERDTKKVAGALESLRARRDDTGIQLAGVAGGWQLRTNPGNAAWVSKLVAAKPQRLSRALLETLAIVAYRQPITRPEIDDIRGVDCGPVLKTLLDRGLVRMIGKREEVGRPILYGTTPEFLRTFSLKDLAELPTLREFHELSAAQMAEVDAKTEAAAPAGEGASVAAPTPSASDLPPVDPEEEERLLRELDSATSAATRAAGPLDPKPEPPAPPAPDAPDAS